MTVSTLSRLRNLCFLITAGTLVAYAFLTLYWATPDPMPPWIPAAAGFGTAAIIYLSARLSGHAVAAIVWDELSRHLWTKSLGKGYWFALLLYPLFALLLATQIVNAAQAFTVMATLTGAFPLLYFIYLDSKGGL